MSIAFAIHRTRKDKLTDLVVMSGIVQNRRGMVDGVSRMANVHCK